MRFDNNGFATRIGQPTDISDLDINDFSKVSYWGKLVHGVTNSIYPQNYGWSHKFSKPDQFNFLSDFTIKKLTTDQTLAKTKPPNCIQNWQKYLPRNSKINFNKTFKTIGTPLTNPIDEKTWLIGILHRNLNVRSKHKNLTYIKCRLCRRHKESIDHFVIHCKPVIRIKLGVKKMLVALGIPSQNLDTSPSNLKPWFTTSLYDSNNQEKQLSISAKALLRIMWRKIYFNFTKVETEKRAFSFNLVIQDIYRLFMSRILAYQHSRRKFYLQRKFSCLPKVLPKKAVKQIKDLGTLNQFTGQLKINKNVKKILQSYKVWNDFDEQIKNNSYKKIYSSYKINKRKRS